jgi:AcrR family transcriptional regulator
MSEKNYHHGDLRSGLIAAGRTILERDGLKALTLRACAREAGVSHAAPQHHFRNLDELLAGIAESGFINFVAALDDGSKDVAHPRRCLIAMGLSYVAFAEQHPALYRVMFGFEAPNIMSEGLEAAMHRAWVQLHDAVAGVTGEEPADSGAILVWSVVHGHAMLRAAQCVPPMINAEAALQQSLETVVAGLAAPIV